MHKTVDTRPGPGYEASSSGNGNHFSSLACHQNSLVVVSMSKFSKNSLVKGLAERDCTAIRFLSEI